MASSFTNTQPIKRDFELEGYPVRVTINAEGVTFIRKGDRHVEKPTVKVSWVDIAEIGAERDPNCEGGFYKHLGFDE